MGDVGHEGVREIMEGVMGNMGHEGTQEIYGKEHSLMFSFDIFHHRHRRASPLHIYNFYIKLFDEYKFC